MHALKLRPTMGILVALVSAGCATNRVRVDYNPRTSFTAFRTYAWSDQDADASGGPALNSPLLEKRIRQAVDSALTSRGYEKLTAGSPDFWVASRVVAEKKSRVDQPYGYGFYGYGGSYGFGYPYYGHGRFGRRHFGHGHSNHFGYRPYYGSGAVREYVEGTLILDVVDARSDELIWRGWMSEALDDDPKPENVRMYVDAAVSKILARFPHASDAPARLPTAKPTTT